MRVVYSIGSLETAADWDGLAHVLGDGHPDVVQNTIRHLRILGLNLGGEVGHAVTVIGRVFAKQASQPPRPSTTSPHTSSTTTRAAPT